jgi:hypothetical protein
VQSCKLTIESRHSTRHNPEKRKNSTMKTQNDMLAFNPIVQKFMGDFRFPNTWADWLEDWEKANTPRDWDKLIFCGYDYEFGRRRANEEPMYTPADRTKFYLACADTSNSSDIPWSESRVHAVRHEGKLVMLSHYRRMQSLCEKATKMLCLYEFKPWLDKGRLELRERDPHAEYFTSDDLLPTLMHFFGKSDGEKFRYCNFYCPDSFDLSHVHELLYKFVLKLIETILNWSEDRLRLSFYSTNTLEIQKFENHLTKTKARFYVAKIWAIEMLASMHKIDLLKEIDTLDLVVLETLQTIELRTLIKTGKGSGTRFVKNHNEACLAGSDVAWFLNRYLTERELDFDGAPIRKKKTTRRIKCRKVGRC